jgi:uncharacterized membrane protein
MATILKFVVIAGLMIGGAFFLAKGLGVNIPIVEYNGLKAQNVPVGIALLVIGVLIARFWKVTKKVTQETTSTTTTKDGTETTTTTTTTFETAAAPPSDFGANKDL